MKSLGASAKYFGLIGGVYWPPRRHKIGLLGKDIASATHFWTPRHITFVASVCSLFGEMCFLDVVYISLDSVAHCVLAEWGI